MLLIKDNSFKIYIYIQDILYSYYCTVNIKYYIHTTLTTALLLYHHYSYYYY